jgi:hypothetical protein
LQLDDQPKWSGPLVQQVCLALDRMSDEQRKEVRDYANHLMGFHTNTVEERVPYKDGYLQNEYRFTKKGTRQGPYMYFYWFENDRQKRIYIGKCSVEEAKKRVDEKRDQ